MSIIAIITNCGLIAVGTAQLNVYFPVRTAAFAMSAIAVLEHIFLVIKFVLTVFIPDEPMYVIADVNIAMWLSL